MECQSGMMEGLFVILHLNSSLMPSSNTDFDRASFLIIFHVANKLLRNKSTILFIFPSIVHAYKQLRSDFGALLSVVNKNAHSRFSCFFRKRKPSVPINVGVSS